MLSLFQQIWPPVWHFIWDFLVVAVIYKIIAAHWVAEHLSAWGSNALKKTEKRATILAHYMSQVTHEGHTSSIYHCHDGGCATLR